MESRQYKYTRLWLYSGSRAARICHRARRRSGIEASKPSTRHATVLPAGHQPARPNLERRLRPQRRPSQWRAAAAVLHNGQAAGAGAAPPGRGQHPASSWLKDELTLQAQGISGQLPYFWHYLNSTEWLDPAARDPYGRAGGS